MLKSLLRNLGNTVIFFDASDCPKIPASLSSTIRSAFVYPVFDTASHLLSARSNTRGPAVYSGCLMLSPGKNEIDLLDDEEPPAFIYKDFSSDGLSDAVDAVYQKYPDATDLSHILIAKTIESVRGIVWDTPFAFVFDYESMMQNAGIRDRIDLQDFNKDFEIITDLYMPSYPTAISGWPQQKDFLRRKWRSRIQWFTSADIVHLGLLNAQRLAPRSLETSGPPVKSGVWND